MVSIGQDNTLADSRIGASVDGQKLFGKQLYSFITVKTTDELRGTRWIRVAQFDYFVFQQVLRDKSFNF